MPAVETFYSRNIDEDLATVRWTGLDAIALHWERLLRVLESLAQADEVRDLSGHISVDPGGGDDEPLERWPVSLDVAGLAALRQRLHEAQRVWPDAMPDRVTLRASALLLLPRGVSQVRVIAWDLPDPVEMEPLPLEPEASVACPPGYAAWRVRSDPGEFEEYAPLYIMLTCELSQWAQQMRLRLRSRYDLWRLRRFDESSTALTGAVNFECLRESMARLAARTDGELVAYDPGSSR